VFFCKGLFLLSYIQRYIALLHVWEKDRCSANCFLGSENFIGSNPCGNQGSCSNVKSYAWELTLDAVLCLRTNSECSLLFGASYNLLCQVKVIFRLRWLILVWQSGFFSARSNARA
jgi:hypothetical protein